MSSHWRNNLLLVTGALVVAASIAHGFAGWPENRAALVAAGAADDLVEGLGAGWLFGSATMAAFGVIAILTALARRRGRSAPASTIYCMAAAFIAFGIGSCIGFHVGPHFIAFIVLGTMLAIGAPAPGA